MTTETTKTLDQIHSAMETAELARATPGLTPEQRYDLESASVTLLNLEQAILGKLGTGLARSLSADSTVLYDLAQKIKQSADSLAEAGNAMEKVAKVVKASVTILSAGAGLL